MGRASYIYKRDGRWWIQVRFDPFRRSGDHSRHLRFALRTSAYALALRRMSIVMSLVTEFRLIDEHREAAVRLFEKIDAALRISPPYTGDQIMDWLALERLGNRVIGGATAVNHPIGVHSPEFWPTWKRFVERNALIEAALTKGHRSGSRQELGPIESLPHEIKRKLGIEDLPVSDAPFRAHRPGPVFDNGTDLRAIRTEWGREEADFVRSPDDVTGPSETFKKEEERQRETLPRPEVHTETLAEAIAARLTGLEKQFGDGRGDESHGRVLRFALSFLGDQPLSAIAAADLRRLETALTEIPQRKGIPRKHADSLYTRYLFAKERGVKNFAMIGETTLRNTYYGSMNSFLDWCREKTDWQPPTFRFNAETADAPPAQPRDSFRDEELVRFFELPLFTGCASASRIWQPGACFVQNGLYWGYLFHLLTGMRPSEIARVRTSDLVCEVVRTADGKDRVQWWIDFRSDEQKAGIQTDKVSRKRQSRKLKTSSSYRRVPVPMLFIDLGLEERKKSLEKLSITRMFPDWHIYHHPTSGRPMPGHYLSKSWQYVKTEFKFEREFLTLYSGRHTIAGWYDEANLPERIRNRTLGHKTKTTAGGYGPIDLTPAEASLALSAVPPVQLKIADILLTAKLKAEYEMLHALPLALDEGK